MANLKLDRKSFLRMTGLAGMLAAVPNVIASTVADTDKSKLTKKRLLRVAHITDIHVMPGRVPEYGMAQAMHQLNGMADRPNFIITGGDSIMDAMSTPKDKVKGMWSTFHNIWKSDNVLTGYHTLGNHDHFNVGRAKASYAESKKWACDEFQIAKPYYFFDKGQWRFVILDSIHPKPVIPGYLGMLDTEQMDWLKKTLSDTPSDRFVCVVSHIPILSICTLFDGAKNRNNMWHISGSNQHDDAHELKKIFYESKKVKACLSGHIHLIDQLEYLGTNYYCNGAVCGAWWGGSNQEFAPAFAIMNFYDDGSNDRELFFYDWKKS